MSLTHLLRLWRTIRHLKPVQFYGRLWYRLSRPAPDLRLAPSLRPREGDWQPPACRHPSITGPDAFLFLGETGSLAVDGWDGPERDKLWRYNQHYFDDLNAGEASARKAWHQGLLSCWIADNQPGVGTGWEPYPTSLRIVNWVKWALSGNDLDEEVVTSLAVQARWLMRRLERHLQGNHLFANAKALVFAGLFFSGPEAEKWLAKGLRILAKQIPEQILPDGGQFELSPMYHALSLEDMLDLINVARAYEKQDLVASLSRHIPAMMVWLRTMSHPDGRIAFFNDAAFGVAPENGELFGYAARLGFDEPVVSDGLHYLQHSGYVRIAGHGATMIADVGDVGPDYIPGHAHADTLSFELSVGERRVVVNSGTSVYGLSDERLRQRGSAAHSTLVVDGQNSSEVWSGFRVGRRACVRDASMTRDGRQLQASASHHGYRYLPGRPRHQRAWAMTPTGLTVTDSVTGKGTHLLEVYLHLAPGIRVEPDPTGVGHALVGEAGKALARLRCEGGSLDCTSSSWHPSFGQSEPNVCLRLTAQAALPHKMVIQIDWDV